MGRPMSGDGPSLEEQVAYTSRALALGSDGDGRLHRLIDRDGVRSLFIER